MRWLKPLLKISALLACVFVLICGGLVAYLALNKDKVIAAALDEMKQQVNGELHVDGASLRLSPHFPGVAILLSNVWIKDSLWSRHGQTLLSAKRFYITLNPLRLVTGKVRIGTLEISDGQVCLYTDSTGYSNTSALRRGTDKKKGAQTPEINDLRLRDMRIIVRHEARNKDFDFAVGKLRMLREETEEGWKANIAFNTTVHSMAFNTAKGSFLERKEIAANLKCAYDEQANAITIPLQELKINKQDIDTRGKFTLGDGKSARFELYFGSVGIRYKEALTLLTPGISGKLPDFDFANPVAVQATLIGRTAYRDTPHVHVAWQVRDNTFKTPKGTITHCSFNGAYDNERVPGRGYKDPNALITVSKMTGMWEGIQLQIDTLSVADLVNPVIEGTLVADAEMARINKIAGESVFAFTDGLLHTDIVFKGGLTGEDTAATYLKGLVTVNNAAVTYKPRDIKITHTNAHIRFTGSDVVVDTLSLSCGKSSMVLHGTFKDFLNLFYSSPEKIVMEWDVKSPLVDLTELLPLLKAKRYAVQRSNRDHLSGIPQQLGDILSNNQVGLNVRVDKVVYADFAATELSCMLTLDSNGFTASGAHLKHAGGDIRANARLVQEGSRNKYSLDAHITRVNIRPFFKAFNDFGQDAVTHNEVTGTLSADVKAIGYLDQEGKPVQKSINGEVNILLQGGSLTGFAPMKIIGTLLFRRRQMDSIAFREIRNTLTIKDGKIFVPPLHIESNAINLTVHGVYATAGKGTNLEIDVPLRNPDKDSMITDEALRHKRHMKGLVVRLRATKDDDDGDLKIRFR